MKSFRRSFIVCLSNSPQPVVENKTWSLKTQISDHFPQLDSLATGDRGAAEWKGGWPLVIGAELGHVKSICSGGEVSWAEGEERANGGSLGQQRERESGC